jgi:hypothetical protein
MYCNCSLKPSLVNGTCIQWRVTVLFTKETENRAAVHTILHHIEELRIYRYYLNIANLLAKRPAEFDFLKYLVTSQSLNSHVILRGNNFDRVFDGKRIRKQFTKPFGSEYTFVSG